MMVMSENGAPRIRYNWGPMPFDKNGAHATGREYLWRNLLGNDVWMTEYEDDWTWTENCPTTDEDYIPEEDEPLEIEFLDDDYCEDDLILDWE